MAERRHFTIYHSDLTVAGTVPEIASEVVEWLVLLDADVAGDLLGEVSDRLHGSMAALGRRTGCVPGGAPSTAGKGGAGDGAG